MLIVTLLHINQVSSFNEGHELFLVYNEIRYPDISATFTIL